MNERSWGGEGRPGHRENGGEGEEDFVGTQAQQPCARSLTVLNCEVWYGWRDVGRWGALQVRGTVEKEVRSGRWGEKLVDGAPDRRVRICVLR